MIISYEYMKTDLTRLSFLTYQTDKSQIKRPPFQRNHLLINTTCVLRQPSDSQCAGGHFLYIQRYYHFFPFRFKLLSHHFLKGFGHGSGHSYSLGTIPSQRDSKKEKRGNQTRVLLRSCCMSALLLASV